MKIIANTTTSTFIVELEPFEFAALQDALDDERSLAVKAQRRLARLREDLRKVEERETNEINSGARQGFSSFSSYLDTRINELEYLLTVEAEQR